jgi:hypothetical protein
MAEQVEFCFVVLGNHSLVPEFYSQSSMALEGTDCFTGLDAMPSRQAFSTEAIGT